MSSLIRSNAKLDKASGPAAQFLIGGLTLAPHGLSGHQVCAGSSVGCRAACNLWFAGQRVTPGARARAIADTRELFTNREAFEARLLADIDRHVRKADRQGLRPLIRLNVASDLDWSHIISLRPEITFYDYTKIRARFESYLSGALPENYFLTFSQHERHHSATIGAYLRRGGNVARVFNVPYHPQSGRYGALPEYVACHGQWHVVDGDKHDVRLPAVDGTGRIIGLRLKGTNAAKARARKTRFAMAG